MTGTENSAVSSPPIDERTAVTPERRREPDLEADLAAQGPEPVLDLRPESGLGHARHALRDLRDGFRLFRLGFTLGWLDIKLRYRGSILGPFWMTISTAVMVATMGILYAELFHIDLASYLPFLSFSLVLWSYVSGSVSDGCLTFTSSAGLIHALRIPFSVHVQRRVVKNFLTFLHSVGVIAVVFALFHVIPKPGWELPAGMGLWIIDSYGLTLLVGVLGARFRDVQPVMSSIMQILFFVTPILWKPELMGDELKYLLFDPFYPLIEIIRQPFMGESPSATIWEVACGYSIALWIVAFLLFARLRARLAYWV